jgi:putative flippase GtrA
MGNEENYVWIALIAHFISVINAFICHKHLVFRSHQNWPLEFLRFNLSYFFSLTIGIALLVGQVRFLHWHPILAQGITVTFSTVISYLLHQNFSFRKFSSETHSLISQESIKTLHTKDE